MNENNNISPSLMPSLRKVISESDNLWVNNNNNVARKVSTLGEI